tara:strand:+ start:176 stop:889 length:714 start_codon:yes stop_codon:yes gene_type:complete
MAHTAQIIDFGATLDARRSAQTKASAEQARAEAQEKRKSDLAERLGGSIAAHIVAEVVTDVEQRQIEQARADRFVPAYCDPENEKRGTKHDATRNLDISEIAKRMRADIKALQLGSGIKTSVRIQRYSGGQSIDIRITALPSGFAILSDQAASWRKQFPQRAHDCPGSLTDQRSAEFHSLMTRLERIHGAYNRDNSDSMTDYFDVRYYGSVSLDWQLRRDLEAAQVDANPGTYWAED